MPGTAGARSITPGLGDPHRPQPPIDTHGLDRPSVAHADDRRGQDYGSSRDSARRPRRDPRRATGDLRPSKAIPPAARPSRAATAAIRPSCRCAAKC
jgi:hypothetical protein